jgi:foldase protein PrsA
MKAQRTTGIAVTAAILVIAIVAIGTLAALHRGPWARAEVAPDLGPVIAEVNGDPIFLADARSRIDGIATVHGEISDVLGEDWQQVVLQSLVDDQLLSQEAEELGIEVTEEDMQTWYAEIQGSIGSDQTVDQWLQTQGMTRTEMERTIARQIIGTRVFAAVTEGVDVSTTRLREYYESHLSDYTAPDGPTTPFRDVRESILAQVEKDDEAAAYATWLEQERQAATVVVLLEDWWRDLP